MIKTLVAIPDKCILCGRCLMECPDGMITIDLLDQYAVKCDLCGGNPEYVKHCRESFHPGNLFKNRSDCKFPWRCNTFH